MLGFVFKRALYGLLVLFGVVTVVFFIFNIKPGDPARMLSDQRANEQTLEAIRKDLGLNRPIFQRYLLYLNDISPVSINQLIDRESARYLERVSNEGPDHGSHPEKLHRDSSPVQP